MGSEGSRHTSSNSLSVGFDVSFRESWTAVLKAADSATMLIEKRGIDV